MTENAIVLSSFAVVREPSGFFLAEYLVTYALASDFIDIANEGVIWFAAERIATVALIRR